jgi:hypothetical protein
MYLGSRGGTVLSLALNAQREDTLAQGGFSEGIMKHIVHSFTFARGLGLGIERSEGIILVTGSEF